MLSTYFKLFILIFYSLRNELKASEKNCDSFILIFSLRSSYFFIKNILNIKNISGHSGKVKCIAVTKPAQYLLTGAEDTSIIVWDLKTHGIHLKIDEHIAPVLCVTSALNNSVIISGGEDSSIIVTSLTNGKTVSIVLATIGKNINFFIFADTKIGSPSRVSYSDKSNISWRCFCVW